MRLSIAWRAGAWQQQYHPAHQNAGNIAFVQPQQQTFVQPNGLAYPPVVSQPQSESNRYSAAYTPTYPQPQYTHQSPYQNADSPYNQPSSHGTPTYGQAQQAAQVPDILSHLISAGLIPAGKQSVSAPASAKTDGNAQPFLPPLAFNLPRSIVSILNSLFYCLLESECNVIKCEIQDLFGLYHAQIACCTTCIFLS